LQQVSGLKQEICGVHRVANDGVGAAHYRSPIGGGEAEGTSGGQKGCHHDGGAEELQGETGLNSPAWMSTFWTEEDPGERSAQCQEPVIRTAAHQSSRPADEVSNRHERLLDKEHDAATRPQ
jgi:hypothetical protein